MGMMTALTMLLALKAAGCNLITSSLGAGMLTCELSKRSRQVTTDPILAALTGLTVLAWTFFVHEDEDHSKNAFHAKWCLWLVVTGLGLGATISVKVLGLSTMIWMIGSNVVHMWYLSKADSITHSLWVRQLLARVFCLLIVPVSCYGMSIAIHLLLLQYPGQGDGYMSFEFQASLEGSALPAMPAKIVFGSVISLRHQGIAGGYLHSHDQKYFSGSLQQQVTVYNYKNPNSFWLIESGPRSDGRWDDPGRSGNILDGASIRLRHQSTRLHLHSHDVSAPARAHNEVSAYGNEGFDGDENDLFRVEIIQSLSANPTAREYLRTHESVFRLVHIKTGRSLFSDRDRLPPWGACHYTVTCSELPLYSSWSIEDNELPMLQSEDVLVEYSPSTSWTKFLEYQKVMWARKTDTVNSNSISWPQLDIWRTVGSSVPKVWTSTAALILTYLYYRLARFQSSKSHSRKDEAISILLSERKLDSLVSGWILHYFPSWFQIQYDHVPGIYFANMILWQIVEVHLDSIVPRYTKPLRRGGIEFGMAILIYITNQSLTDALS